MDGKLLIGIDGGGTKTRVQASLGDPFRPTFSRDYPASNYNNISVDEVVALLVRVREDLSLAFGAEAVSRARLAMGTAGVDRPADAVAYKDMLARAGFACPSYVANDAIIALVGANGARAGALLLAGTGSIAVGIAKDGGEVRVGGWGAEISDEGSGFRLGIDAITAVMRSYDGVLPPTLLTGRLLAHFALPGPEGFVDLVYLSGPLPIDAIASAAPIVLSAAEDGDAAASAIVSEGAGRLADMARALASKMGLSGFRLSTAGGLLDKSEFYRAKVSQQIARRLPGLEISPRLNEPCAGALVLAAGMQQP
jgi:N-acetylglucosamine kinase-like BadF-type ATPase